MPLPLNARVLVTTISRRGRGEAQGALSFSVCCLWLLGAAWPLHAKGAGACHDDLSQRAGRRRGRGQLFLSAVGRRCSRPCYCRAPRGCLSRTTNVLRAWLRRERVYLFSGSLPSRRRTASRFISHLCERSRDTQMADSSVPEWTRDAPALPPSARDPQTRRSPTARSQNDP